MSSEKLRCYNKGCGKNYTLEENIESCCQYHPGAPIFHDARKGWSCCNRFSTDFSVFLGMPGCTKGKHNNVKPVEPTPEPKSGPIYEQKVVEVKPLPKPEKKFNRPSADLPLDTIANTVSPSLIQALDTRRKAIEKEKMAASATLDENAVPTGTECQNNGCKVTFAGPDTNKEICLHHPGFPIFHEGLKFWTCCQRKTTEWEMFMEQIGCSSGKHNWIKKTPQVHQSCRFDWFQTGTHVTVSFYAKTAVPDTTLIQANQVKLSVSINFDAGQSKFERSFNLFGTVNGAESTVKLLGTKVEVNLKKADPMSWSQLELPPVSQGDTKNHATNGK